MASSNQITFQVNDNQQSYDHVYPVPPPNQAPTLAIPNLYSDAELLSMEFSQLSFEISNECEKMEKNLQLQHLETVNAIKNEHTKQYTVIHNYVTKLLGLIIEKEKELAATTDANMELQKCVANLNRQLEMIEESFQMVRTSDEPDAGSSCGDDFTKDDMVNCQMCRKELSCELILPCNHLCCCTSCEAYVYSCPVCATVKERSIKVSWPQMKNQGGN